jgi:cyclohexanecarboxylate-CoA ligase
MTITLDPKLVAERGRGMREAGFWPDRTVDAYLAENIARHPDRTAVVSYRADGRTARRLSYRELGRMVDLAAGALRERGVGRGDVVSIQLPNCWEFVIAALACIRLGAAANPMVPILREREVRYMVGFCDAKVLVVPKVFRGFDHADMARTLRDSLPKLDHVIVVDEDGAEGFEQALLGGKATVPYDPAAPALLPDDLLVLMYTSGTTGEPKGVMHTSNTVNGNVLVFSQGLGLNGDDVFFAATPVGHMTGYGIFVLLPMMLGNTLVLQDIHDPHAGVRIMEAEGVTFTAGATPFLADLCDAAISDQIRPSKLRRFYCAGAPIPPALVQRAGKELKLTVSSVWGMTEVIAGTMTEPGLAERAWTTDGRALPGIEVKVVDDDGRELPRGETGRLLVRGASMFCGYLKRPELYTVAPDGWFDSGDLARMDEQGYIRITGRTKELLIRGGENVPVIEIENLLLQHPAIAAVAIVGFPDARLGERACAFVVPRPGQTVDLPAVQAYLSEMKVAKPFWPERVEHIDELPHTASGKVQRFVLKQKAAAFSAG